MKTKRIFWWLWLIATALCSGMDSESHKTMRVPTFSGEQKDYQAWWMRFSAFAALMGFSAALSANQLPNLPGTEAEVTGANGDSEDEKKARAVHNKARLYLILAMVKESLLYTMMQTATVA